MVTARQLRKHFRLAIQQCCCFAVSAGPMISVSSTDAAERGWRIGYFRGRQPRAGRDANARGAGPTRAVPGRHDRSADGSRLTAARAAADCDARAAAD